MDVILVPNDSNPLPQRYKNRRMWQIERAHSGRDIRLIMADLYAKHRTWTAVASKLGLPNATIHAWRKQLGVSVLLEVRLQ